ncbi:MAG: hypothetical protein PVI21_04845 [Candidatus Woesebacteria bacterium]|jgi:hypothetical protein
MSSVIRHYITLDNNSANAHHATAAEVIRLAQHGYLSVELDGTEVRLTRTAKASSKLPRESELLLHALFGFTEPPNSTRHICSDKNIPVAQSLAIITDDRMLKERHIEEIDTVKFRILAHGGYAITAAAVFITLTWLLDYASLWFLWLTLMVLGWIMFAVIFIDPTLTKGYRFTKSGKRFEKEAKKVRHRVTRKKMQDYEIFHLDLPFELLWHTTNGAYFAPSIRKGSFDNKPSWYDGKWPNDQLLVKDIVNRIFETLATAFEQPYSNYEDLQGTLDFETFVTLKDTLDFLPANQKNDAQS